MSFIHHHWKAKHTKMTIWAPKAANRVQAHQTTASLPQAVQAVTPSQPSHQPPWHRKLLKLTNPAENCPHCSADLLKGQWHQCGQRGSQGKWDKAVGEHHPAGDKDGGGLIFLPLAEANLVLSLHFASCKQLESYYKSTECASIP